MLWYDRYCTTDALISAICVTWPTPFSLVTATARQPPVVHLPPSVQRASDEFMIDVKRVGMEHKHMASLHFLLWELARRSARRSKLVSRQAEGILLPA